MPDITKRLLTDATGQDIVEALNGLIDAVDPTGSAAEATSAAQDANTAATAANNAATAAGRVNITSSKSNHVVTIQTTDKSNVKKTTTIREPTALFTSNNGNVSLSITTGDGTQTVTIPDPNREHYSLAHKESVSRAKTRAGNPIQIEDAVNEIADKTVIKLVPKQDLHGYDKPWVGGAGKNLLPMNHVSNVNPNSPNITVTDSSDGWLVVNGTASANFILISNLFSGTMDLTNQSDNIKHLPNGSYKMAIWTSGTGVEARLQMYKSDGTNASLVLSLPSTAASNVAEVTIDDTFTYNFCRLFIGAGTYTNFKVRVMVCKSTDDATTFAPYTNICPISGYDTVNVVRSGKNKIIKTFVGYNVESNGTFAGGSTFSAHVAQVEKGKTYIISGNTDSPNGIVYSFFYAEPTTASVSYNNSRIAQASPKYFTAPITGYVAVRSYKADANVQVEEGTVATSYKAPSGAVYPLAVSLATNGNQTAGTVYSGTVTLLADGSGQVVVDRKCIDLGDYTWTYASSQHRFYISPADAVFSGNSEVSNIICSKYGVTTFGSVTNEREDKVIAGSTTAGGTYLTVRDTDYSDATVFRIAVTGTQVVYPLATPVTYTLTANQIKTLLGYNYIYTDGAEIALTYRQESLATNETLLKLLPTGTATGNPVTFSDGADSVPLKQLVVNVQPNQDLHGYEKPWVAGAGKNLCPIDSVDFVPATTWVSLTNTNANTYTSGTKVSLKAGTYYVSITEATNVNSFQLFDSAGNALRNGSSGSFTLSAADDVYIRIKASSTSTALTLKIQIESGSSATDWTPYENICPIRGWDSVPLLRAEGIIKNPENIELGNIEANGSEVDSTTRLRTGYTQVTENTKYTIEYSHTAGTYCGIFYFSGTTPDTFISYESWAAQPRTFTTPNGANYVRFTFQSPTLPTNVRLKTDNMKSYDISIPSEAGTVYGCQIVLDENGEGELKVIKKLARAGDMSWSYYDAYTYYGGMFFSDDLKSVIRHDSEDIVFATSSAYVGLTGAQSKAKGEINEHINGGIRVRTSDGRIYIRSDDYNNASAFATANKDVEICYELANPITYSLTADQVKTLLGTNIISSDAGNVSVKYFKVLGEEQDLTPYAPKSNPTFTGSIKIGNTTLTEAKLQALLSLAAGG